MIFGRYTIGSVITLERSKTRDVFHQTSPNMLNDMFTSKKETFN